MTNDLIEVLRGMGDYGYAYGNEAADALEAKDEQIAKLEYELKTTKHNHNEWLKTLDVKIVDKQTAIIAELIEALTPFAMAADDIEDNHVSGNIWESPAAINISVDDLMKAKEIVRKYNDGLL
jgi:hypothetical protein